MVLLCALPLGHTSADMQVAGMSGSQASAASAGPYVFREAALVGAMFRPEAAVLLRRNRLHVIYEEMSWLAGM